MYFNEPEQIALDEIKSRILSLKTADDVNMVKVALIQWKNCFPDSQIPDEAFMAIANNGKVHVKMEKKDHNSATEDFVPKF